MQNKVIVKIEDSSCEILISDEPQALLAAKAAGRAVVGYAPAGEYLPGADYVVESLKDVDGEYLERIARRFMGLPWKICESERLLIREFGPEDAKNLKDIWPGALEERSQRLSAYIDCQYRFYEFGIWAIIRKEDNKFIGYGGFSPVEQEDTVLAELGYHIFVPYRRQGYAKEACRAMLQYGRVYLGFDRVACRIAPSNQASLCTVSGLDVEIRLLEPAENAEE